MSSVKQLKAMASERRKQEEDEVGEWAKSFINSCKNIPNVKEEGTYEVIHS